MNYRECNLNYHTIYLTKNKFNGDLLTFHDNFRYIRMRQTILLFTLITATLSTSAQTMQEWKDSISVLSKMIENHPRDLELKMRKAEANIALEQWEYATDEYSSILDIYPTHLGALYFRGYTNYKLRRYGFARQDYESVLKYEPRHMGAFMGLIRTNLADGKTQKAQDQADFLVGLYPDSATVYVFRAEVEAERNMIDLAIQDYSTAIRIEERNIGINQRLTGEEDYTNNIICRMELYRKKGDAMSLSLMDQDRNFLISKGIPSGRLVGFELKPRKK